LRLEPTPDAAAELVTGMNSPSLTAQVLEEVHTAAEYHRWVRALISRVKEEPEGIEQIRLRRGLAKELMNEALPIGLLASSYFSGSDEVSIQLKIGNQNYDAQVFDRRDGGLRVDYIEVTVAGDGEDDHLRMRALHEHGEVSGLGAVRRTGTQKTGLKIHVDREMIAQSEQLRRENARIAGAIQRKLSKKYPPNTLLLLAFDDTMAFDRPDNRSAIEATVAAFLPQLTSFHSVALIGMEAGMLMSWKTGHV
jgi:hypothetical protein